MQISKSDYMIYRKHPAWLWLKKNNPDRLPDTSEQLEAIMAAGRKFESIVEKKFNDFVKIPFDSYDDYLAMPDLTDAAVASKAKIILQGRFESDQFTCIADVLMRVSDEVFDLYEIKMSSRPKDDHLHDLAFQTAVIEASGITIRSIGVIHVNSRYIKQGEIDPEAISKSSDVTRSVRTKLKSTTKAMQAAFQIAGTDEMPDDNPRFASSGGFRDWLEIYRFFHDDLPEDSIYDLISVGKTRLGELQDRDVELIKDIPDAVALTLKQKNQRLAVQRGDSIILKDKIANFLTRLSYPLYFLDFETMSSTVPVFDGMRPYQQVPFQYSLHIIEKPGAKVKHLEYLHTDATNPVEPIAERLIKDLKTEGSIIAWYADFEMGCIRTLASMAPELGPQLFELNQRFVDLMIPFSSQWFVNKDFNGSASIKKVLPALVPELSYKEMDIGNGEVAQRQWMQNIAEPLPKKKQDKLFKDLRAYCELDTLAMVEIWKVLVQAAK